MKRGFQFVTLILEFSVVLATSVVRGDGTTLTVGGGPGGPGGTHHTELPSSCFGSFKRARRTAGVGIEQGAAETTLTVRPDYDSDYTDFCSNFLQPAQVTATTTKRVTTTATITASTIVSVVKTITSGGSYASGPAATTVTLLCPIAPPSTVNTTCGLNGWGYATNNLYSSTNDALTCHQLCLQNSRCASFQVVANTSDPSPHCDLYSVPSGGNNTIAGAASPYVFFDRDCPDFSPPGCTDLRLTRTAALIPRGGEVAQPTYTPPLFSLMPSDSISDACSCLLTTALPTIGANTKTISISVVVRTTVTKTLTQDLGTVVVIGTGGGSGGTATIYSSVQ